MKVLLVTGIFPPDIGGPASYVPRVAQALLERGHTVEVVTLADREAMPNPRQFGFRVHRIERQMPRPRRVARTIALIRSLAREFDIVYAHGLVLETVIAAQLAAKPVVLKVVGDTIWERARNAGREESLDAFQSAPLPIRWRLLQLLQNAKMRRARRVITPSEYLKRIVNGWGVPADRISVVHNAVPRVADAGVDTAPDVDLVSVGRLVSWKGFDQLIDIAARRGWSLSIVGDGPLREELESRAREVGAAVRFEGHLPQEEVAAAIRRARVFVLNSSYEGLPHIVLEAMAAGVPVVATSAGGTPETIIDGESGFLVPVGQADRLEEIISRLLRDDALRRAVVARASVILEHKFSFEHMVSQTEQILATALETSSRSRNRR